MEDVNKQKNTAKNEEASTEEFEEAVFAPLAAEYLLERGYCCGNGCINCPYYYKAVPEPKRSQLLEKRNDTNSNESQK